MEAKEVLLRIVLPALLLYAVCCLAAARRELAAAQETAARLRAELAAAEAENLARAEKLRQGWSGEELEALARERLGLVLPGERIFLFAPGPDGETGNQSRNTERDLHGVADRRNP